MATNTKKASTTKTSGTRLTADNVVDILQHVRVPEWKWRGAKWEFIAKFILAISANKRAEIFNACAYTDEQHLLNVIVMFWFQKFPYASWRWLILRLEYHSFPDLAMQICDFAEPLTENRLSVKTLVPLLSPVSMDTLEDCLQIPFSKRWEIQQQSKSEEERRQRLIKWYLDYSPFANFNDLAGSLFYCEETSVLEQVKKYVEIVPEPTLTVSNVTETLKQTHIFRWDGSGLPYWLNIPPSKDVYDDHLNVFQRIHTFVQLFVEDHPCPSWQRIAYAVYRGGEYRALEVIQREYFKGTSESRRHFKKAMKKGFLLTDITQLLLFGPAGVGKTCTKAIMLGQDIPTTRRSTPLAERSVQVYRAKITSSKWEELSREDRDKIIAQAVYCCELDDLPEHLEKQGIEQIHIQTENKKNAEGKLLPKQKKLSHDTSSSPISSQSERPMEASTDIATAKPVMATTDDKLLVLMDGCSLDDPLDKINRIQITDSGGQPQFHEVLPIFLRGTSVYLFFQKLSEKLDDYSRVEYFDENGKSVCTPYQASHTNLQIFEHCLRVMHSQRSKSSEKKPARIIVIGTFKDEAHKCSETIETKNKRFLEVLLPMFEKEVVYYDLIQPKKVIFPLNASNPGEAGEKIIDQVHGLISTECTANPVEVPLQWHALESLLEEMSENLKRSILMKEECFRVAKQKLHFEEGSFDAALEYLDHQNMIFYFPDILPNVIFADTKVLLDKVTELVLAIHRLQHGFTKMPFTTSWQRFHDNALVSEEFLAQTCFNKHYVSQCFTQKELLVLFSELMVFAKFNEKEFFMPSLLRMLSKEEVEKHRVDKSSTSAAPIAITFSGDVPRLGVFCASVVYLLSSKNHHPCQWELKMTDTSTPSCLYRNCVEFKIPDHPGTVIFIDAFKHFEIHLRLPGCVPNIEKTICPLVRSAVFEALRNADLALHYKISEPSLCLLCPCDAKEYHAASIKPGYYICFKDSDVCGPLTPNHRVWSEEPQTPSTSDRRLTENDIPQLMEKLAPHAAKWSLIGTALSFTPSELDLIAAKPLLLFGAPTTYLTEMLCEWVQWSPQTVHAKYATITDLRQALRSQIVGLGALSETF